MKNALMKNLKNKIKFKNEFSPRKFSKKKNLKLITKISLKPKTHQCQPHALINLHLPHLRAPN